MTTEDKTNSEYIEIQYLSDYLQSDYVKEFPVDIRQMQITEEIVFLCANNKFISDILKLRDKLMCKFPELNLPIDIKDTDKGSEILKFIYLNFYKEYQKSMSNILIKYKLIPELYWLDIFSDSVLGVEGNKITVYADGKKLSRKEAITKALEELENNEEEFEFENDKEFEDSREFEELSILDNIVIYNKPINPNSISSIYKFVRTTFTKYNINLDLKDKNLPRLQISFPIYSTLSEMQKILKDNYKKIQEFRELHTPLQNKRDHRKDNLQEMIDAYSLFQKGESILKISIFLEKKYKKEYSFEAVKQIINRVKIETSRFDN